MCIAEKAMTRRIQLPCHVNHGLAVRLAHKTRQEVRHGYNDRRRAGKYKTITQWCFERERPEMANGAYSIGEIPHACP